MNYLQKPLFKSLLSALFILVSIIIIASILLNIFLANSKGRIEQSLSNLLNQKVNIKGIFFLPPNFIIVKNIFICKTIPPKENPPIFIETGKCMFSLFRFIAKRDFVITNIGLYRLTTGYPFKKESFEEILEAINSLAQEQPFKMRIREARLNISQETRPARFITLNANFAIIPNQSIISSGSIGLYGLFAEKSLMEVNFIPKAFSLPYSFQLLPTEEGFMIEDLEFRSPQFNIKLWGMLEKNVLTLSGSLSSSNFSDLDIYDLTSVIKFEFPDIYIQNVNFSLRDMPFLLKGKFFLAPSPTLNLKLSSFPDQPPTVRLNNPKGFDISLTGDRSKGKFNATVNFDFLRKTKTKAHLQSVEAILKNLTLFTTEGEKLKMSFEKATLSYISGNNVNNVFLKDFSVIFYLEDGLVKFVKINSIIYDGVLEGRGVLDFARMPFKNSFDINISDVSAERLHSLLMYCSKIYGRLSSQIHYRNYPNLILNGKLLISDGLLDNIIFFKWVSDFLCIPSLNQINFDSLSADFIVNDEYARVENIYLASKEVNFNGYFTLYENDLVSSNLSLVLSKRLLNDSSKLRRLVNYFDKDVASLNFNFQLSGFFQAMNFKWSDSNFKKVLQDLLPYRLEKKLESEIEAIIESISKKITSR